MKVLSCVLAAALALLAALMCVYGFSRLTREGGGVAHAETEVCAFLSEDPLSDGDEDLDAEEESAEVKQWVKVVFDAVVIAASVGVIFLVWRAARRVMKKYGSSGRRFG